MKKLLLILLMTIIPLQFSWGAISVYCQHEEGVAAQHFGHHEHKHQSADGKKSEDPAKKSLGEDPDCCMHHSCVKYLTSYVSAPLAVIQKTVFQPIPLAFDSYIPGGLERPDRHLSA